jgi:hypothetical protein
MINLNTDNFIKLNRLLPVVRKYGIERTQCLFSSDIFNLKHDTDNRQLIDIFSFGMSKNLDAILKLIIEMVSEGIIDRKIIPYAFAMGYDYTFTINIILQFSDLLKVMSSYKIKKIAHKVDHKVIYTFLREANNQTAEEAAKLIERRDKNFFKKLNETQIKLSEII